MVLFLWPITILFQAAALPAAIRPRKESQPLSEFSFRSGYFAHFT